MTETARIMPTAFEQIGGIDSVRQLVDRFYDLMDQDPRYAALRAMHHAELAPIRASLTGFLVGWLGGPRDWFMRQDSRCVMSLHADLAVTPATAGEWLHAMERALQDIGVDRPLASILRQAFARMAAAMIRQA
ncbi:group II truncated hemoglobin [Sphingomonas sp.]|uniref:group II truncated hemoglobin n=1 Tax=Sphingomonas sp. TaxID=28214 RepID=UPI003B3B6A95